MSYRDRITSITQQQYDLFLKKLLVDEVFVRVVKDGDLIVANRGYRCYGCLNPKKYLQIVTGTELYLFQEYENAEILLCDDCRKEFRSKKEKFDKKWLKHGIIREKDCIEIIDFDATEKELIESLTTFETKLIIDQNDMPSFFEHNSDIFEKNVLKFFDMICDTLEPDSSLKVGISNFEYLKDKLALIYKKLKYFTMSLHQYYYLLNSSKMPDHLVVKFTSKQWSSRPFLSTFPSDGRLKISKSATLKFKDESFKFSSVTQENRFQAGDVFVTNIYSAYSNFDDDSIRAGVVLAPTNANYLVIFPNGKLDYIPHYYLKYCDLQWHTVFESGSQARLLVNSYLRCYPTTFIGKIEIGHYYKTSYHDEEKLGRVLTVNGSLGFMKFKNHRIESILPLSEYYKSVDLCDDPVSVSRWRKVSPHLLGQSKKFEWDSYVFTPEVSGVRKRKCTVCAKAFDKVSIIEKQNLYKVSMIAIPKVYGWTRRISNGKVYYDSPCRKEFCKLVDIRNHIWWSNDLDIEYFTFEPNVNIKRRLSSDRSMLQTVDLSCKTEYYPISVYNGIDNEILKVFMYSTSVVSNITSVSFHNEFKTCCECTNDCINQNTCSCRQLTLKNAGTFFKHIGMDVDVSMLGYHFKKLYEAVQTGIYECNSNCPCSSKCVNRLVQFPTKVHFQVFKTAECGWGVRVLHDVPEGTFVGVYTGELLFGHAANALEFITEDTYLADLDFIEVVEGMKDGYEEEYGDAKRRKRSSDVNQDEVRKSARDYFHEHTPYTINGKNIGNIGRFFNHSCNPNVFVQNVFIETHDLRFPHVAFFAAKNLKAGKEVTWDYSYEVDSVPGKCIECKCKAENCRKRLI